MHILGTIVYTVYNLNIFNFKISQESLLIANYLDTIKTDQNGLLIAHLKDHDKGVVFISKSSNKTKESQLNKLHDSIQINLLLLAYSRLGLSILYCEIINEIN